MGRRSQIRELSDVYNGEMARPTKRSIALAKIVGVSPSRFQVWHESGLLPAQDVPQERLLAHCLALVPLMGRVGIET